MRANLAYKFNYHTQKYSLRYTIASILFVSLSMQLNSVFQVLPIAIFISTILNKYGIFKNTYVEMLNKYLKKTNNIRFKCVYTDTTFIVNKYGINYTSNI